MDGQARPQLPTPDRLVCPICEHEYARRELTRHHLIPKCRKGREIVLLCRSCHSMIHATWSEKELERNFPTLEALLDSDELRPWIRWIRRHRPNGRVRVKQNRQRR